MVVICGGILLWKFDALLVKLLITLMTLFLSCREESKLGKFKKEKKVSLSRIISSILKKVLEGDSTILEEILANGNNWTWHITITIEIQTPIELGCSMQKDFVFIETIFFDTKIYRKPQHTSSIMVDIHQWIIYTNTHSVHARVDKLISSLLIIPEDAPNLITSDSQEVDIQRQDSPQVDSQKVDSQELDKLVEALDMLVEEVVDHKLEEDIQQLVGKADLVGTYVAQAAPPLVEDQTCHPSCPFQPCVVSATLIKHSNLRCKLLTRKLWKAYKLRTRAACNFLFRFLMTNFLTSFYHE